MPILSKSINNLQEQFGIISNVKSKGFVSKKLVQNFLQLSNEKNPLIANCKKEEINSMVIFDR